MQELLTFAHSLADAAGNIARRYFQRDVQIETKGDNTPVTIADKEIETAIRQMIARHAPHHAIMGEEFGGSMETTANTEYCWVIDPIDGTKAFISGTPTFTTLIGLLHHGVPVLGLVDQPILYDRWAAITTNQYKPPATLPQMVGAPPVPMSGLRCATTSLDYLSPSQKIAMEHLVSEGVEMTYGGDAYAYMMLTEGKLDAVFDVCLKPYDLLPLLPVLIERKLWMACFEHGKITPNITGNIVVARRAEVGEAVLRSIM